MRKRKKKQNEKKIINKTHKKRDENIQSAQFFLSVSVATKSH